MDPALKSNILDILASAKDLTLATLRPDGWPQATTVSFVSDGFDIYFGCSPFSQKATNLTADPRVSLTIDLPYSNWDSIKGLSMAATASRVSDPADMERIQKLYATKFPEAASYLSADMMGDLALFRLTPKVISVLDYTKGFGHTDLVQL